MRAAPESPGTSPLADSAALAHTKALCFRSQVRGSVAQVRRFRPLGLIGDPTVINQLQDALEREQVVEANASLKDDATIFDRQTPVS